MFRALSASGIFLFALLPVSARAPFTLAAEQRAYLIGQPLYLRIGSADAVPRRWSKAPWSCPSRRRMGRDRSIGRPCASGAGRTPHRGKRRLGPARASGSRGSSPPTGRWSSGNRDVTSWSCFPRGRLPPIRDARFFRTPLRWSLAFRWGKATSAPTPSCPAIPGNTAWRYIWKAAGSSSPG